MGRTSVYIKGINSPGVDDMKSADYPSIEICDCRDRHCPECSGECDAPARNTFHARNRAAKPMHLCPRCMLNHYTS